MLPKNKKNQKEKKEDDDMEDVAELMKRLNKRKHLTQEEQTDMMKAEVPEFIKLWNKMAKENKYISNPAQFIMIMCHLKQIRNNVRKIAKRKNPRHILDRQSFRV